MNDIAGLSRAFAMKFKIHNSYFIILSRLPCSVSQILIEAVETDTDRGFELGVLGRRRILGRWLPHNHIGLCALFLHVDSTSSDIPTTARKPDPTTVDEAHPAGGDDRAERRGADQGPPIEGLKCPGEDLGVPETIE